jgi:hypothetical protein
MTTYNTHRSQIRTIHHTDSRFMIYDKFTAVPRAGFELDRRMPKEYMEVIQTCLTNGWLRPVAHITERELIFMGLSND